MNDRIVLGEGCVYPADPALTGLNGNTLIEGYTPKLSRRLPALYFFIF